MSGEELSAGAGVVESNPLGLDMQLAEGGAPLSAGQKQLVALSRALLRNSKVSLHCFRALSCRTQDLCCHFGLC